MQRGENGSVPSTVNKVREALREKLGPQRTADSYKQPQKHLCCFFSCLCNYFKTLNLWKVKLTKSFQRERERKWRKILRNAHDKLVKHSVSVIYEYV